MCILSISALREIAEDYRRQRDDDQTNNDVSQKLTVRVPYEFFRANDITRRTLRYNILLAKALFRKIM